MSSALAPQHPDPSEAADAYIDVTRRLTRMGVTLAMSALPWADAAIWDPITATLHLNRDSSLHEQLVALCQIWHYVAVGPGASNAQPVRPLRAL